MAGRREVFKLLGALGLGLAGGLIAGGLARGPPQTVEASGVPPAYSVVVQPPGEARPMVVAADGEVVVDSSGRIVSDLGVYPSEGVNELGGYTQTAGIQEAVAYLLNTGGGLAFIRRGDYYPNRIIHIGVIKREVQVILEGEGLATRIHLYDNKGKSQAWAFTIGTPGDSPTADQAPPPVLRRLAFVNDMNRGPPVGPIVTGGYYSGGGAVGNGVILEDITVVDPPTLADGSGAPSPIGWIWFNNSYGVRVRGFTYLGANPNSKSSTVIVSDGVTFTEIDESYFISTARAGVAISSGTGTIQIANTQILGFNIGINYGNTDGRSKLMISNTVIGTDRGGVESYGAQLFVNTPIYVDYGFVDALICCSRLGGVISLLDSVARITVMDSEVHSLTIRVETRNRPQSDLLLTIEGSRIFGSGNGPLINIPSKSAEGSVVRVRLLDNEIDKRASSGEWALITIPNNVVFEARGNYITMNQGFDTIIGLSQDLTNGFYELSDNMVNPLTSPAYLINGGVSITAPFFIRRNKFLAQVQLYSRALTNQSGLVVEDNYNLAA
ncbi:hypothetical protein TUZN_1520 [Thermoproteus uzoniensis 768-20]|uniref:Uncharacterized protein n=1 Tax=Thermoproteus uzoniensis (strain 768-20) TaxID=999630 RepID=F2L264_THEU7|nr:hypothetical protein [Thermoproteus uzoniensis]AEA12991.1 hypothetical protein TUZN_1520 [Thermoproteus uzoniensis 768-20]